MNNNLFATPASNNQASFSKAISNGKDSSNVMQYCFTSNGKATDIFALAKAFLSIESMTHKKLQKLCYYAKAWYLALNDSNLIVEPFQAWVHGAVNPSLYHQYKQYGFDNIPKVKRIEDIPEEFISFSKEIFASYGSLTGDQLEHLNHNETPWINARNGLKPWENCSNEISEQDMKDYYRSIM